MVWGLLYVSQGASEAMLRIGFGLTVLALLFATYSFTAWVVLGTTFTLAVANHMRQPRW